MNSTVYTASASQTKAFELKGEMSMLSVLRLLDSETEHIAQELADKVKQAPEFFRNMPVIIDLQVLAERNEFAGVFGTDHRTARIRFGTGGGAQREHHAE